MGPIGLARVLGQVADHVGSRRGAAAVAHNEYLFSIDASLMKRVNGFINWAAINAVQHCLHLVEIPLDSRHLVYFNCLVHGVNPLSLVIEYYFAAILPQIKWKLLEHVQLTA